jgi:hypothetical protein
MSHQLRILALPEDWQDLGRLLASKRRTIFLEETAEHGLSRTENFYREERFSTYSKVMLVKDGALRDVGTILAGDLVPRVDVLRSPVIEAGLCVFEGRLLRAGRLYYEVGFYGRDQRWRRKTEDFLRWAESVFRLVRRVFPRHPESDSYIGERARQWMADPNNQVAVL